MYFCDETAAVRKPKNEPKIIFPSPNFIHLMIRAVKLWYQITEVR
jgi:hypothetical protein